MADDGTILHEDLLTGVYFALQEPLPKPECVHASASVLDTLSLALTMKTVAVCVAALALMVRSVPSFAPQSVRRASRLRHCCTHAAYGGCRARCSPDKHFAQTVFWAWQRENARLCAPRSCTRAFVLCAVQKATTDRRATRIASFGSRLYCERATVCAEVPVGTARSFCVSGHRRPSADECGGNERKPAYREPK